MSAYVLYVDDEAANLVVFSAALESELPVLTARGGPEALELMKTNDVAVLLTDQRMPGMSGVDLMAITRREHPDTIRMLITAYSDLEAAVDAINRGQADTYLKKPWEPVELTQTLKQARERYMLTQRMRELERKLVKTEGLRALGSIAAGIAHELRNPLTALTMGLRALRLELAPPAPNLAMAARMIDEAEHAANAMAEITRGMELTTRSRLEGPVDLREVVELAAKSVTGEMRRTGCASCSPGWRRSCGGAR